MATYIDLNGTWTLTGVDEFGKALALPGTVPGCVHTDFAANGIVGDFFWRDNSKKVQWIENHDFTYTKTFTLARVSENAWLEFDGLDTYATILLNGKVVGETDNMHIPHAFRVDGLLKTGENTLEVRFDSPIRRVEGLPLHPGAFTQERMNTRRIQCLHRVVKTADAVIADVVVGQRQKRRTKRGDSRNRRGGGGRQYPAGGGGSSPGFGSGDLSSGRRSQYKLIPRQIAISRAVG